MQRSQQSMQEDSQHVHGVDLYLILVLQTLQTGTPAPLVTAGMFLASSMCICLLWPAASGFPWTPGIVAGWPAGRCPTPGLVPNWPVTNGFGVTWFVDGGEKDLADVAFWKPIDDDGDSLKKNNFLFRKLSKIKQIY